MKINFVYSVDRDVENFIKSLHSKNRSSYTKFQNSYIEKYGENFNESDIRVFIEDKIAEIDLTKKITEIESLWNSISAEFFDKTDKIFKYKYSSPITIYLTTNNRCTYNTEENYFFVYMDSVSTNAIIMHELLHFYTWHVFGVELIANGMTKERYNDIKESLTVLLNIEFAGLMAGKVDEGYPQHQELREKIKQLWNEGKDLHTIIELIKF